MNLFSISWEPEGRYHYSMMFQWKPEGCYWLLYKAYGDSTLLVLNGTSFNSINALLVLSRRYVYIVHIHSNKDFLVNISQRYRQLRARRALLQIKAVPLRTRRALLLYKVNSSSALLVLNGTSLSCINALLALSWRYVLYGTAMCKLCFLLLVTKRIGQEKGK